MLPDAEDKQPDQHHGKGWREQSDKENPAGTEDIGNLACLREQEKIKSRNNDRQKTWQFTRQLQKPALKIIDQECFIEKIIESGINDTLRKSENERRRKKQPEVPRQI